MVKNLMQKTIVFLLTSLSFASLFATRLIVPVRYIKPDKNVQLVRQYAQEGNLQAFESLLVDNEKLKKKFPSSVFVDVPEYRRGFDVFRAGDVADAIKGALKDSKLLIPDGSKEESTKFPIKELIGTFKKGTNPGSPAIRQLSLQELATAYSKSMFTDGTFIFVLEFNDEYEDPAYQKSGKVGPIKNK